MHLQSLHPFAAVTGFVFIAGTLANFLTLDWRTAPISNAIAAVLLATPFAVLLAAHLTIAKTWRRHAYLAGGSMLLTVPWYVLSFAMRWFQGGWMGLALACAILIVLALAYSAMARFIGENQAASQATDDHD